MTKPKLAEATDGTSCGAHSPTIGETEPMKKSYMTDERREQDALEDDEVWEALRSLHRSCERPARAK